MKLAITLRHLASGSRFTNMRLAGGYYTPTQTRLLPALVLLRSVLYRHRQSQKMGMVISLPSSVPCPYPSQHTLISLSVTPLRNGIFRFIVLFYGRFVSLHMFKERFISLPCVTNPFYPLYVLYLFSYVR